MSDVTWEPSKLIMTLTVAHIYCKNSLSRSFLQLTDINEYVLMNKYIPILLSLACSLLCVITGVHRQVAEMSRLNGNAVVNRDETSGFKRGKRRKRAQMYQSLSSFDIYPFSILSNELLVCQRD